MKRFRTITDLIKAFRSGDYSEGRTSSVCNNWNTDFKTKPKYYFEGNTYYENGKPTRFINRTLKVEILLSNGYGSCNIHHLPIGMDMIFVRDHSYIRDYIYNHMSSDAAFNLAIRFCLTNSYINDFISIKNCIKHIRENAYYRLVQYYTLRREYQKTRKYFDKKLKEYNVPNVDRYANQEFAISNWKGWKEYWTYYKYDGSIAYADLSLRLSKDEILTLVRKIFYYNSVRLSHHTSKYMPYQHFMKYYDDLANLKNDIKSLANYIKDANLTGYQQWYGEKIKFISKVVQKYKITI